jgi:hypothetical protein
MDLETLIAHHAIGQALLRYCRGVDRGDAALIKSAFWPDAFDNHGHFQGLGWELAERLAYAEGKLPYEGGQHNIGNVYIEIDDPDHARGETYVWAVHPYFTEDGGTRMAMFAGRYHDRFERRDGEWRIASRRVTNDWTRDDVPGAYWKRGSWQEGGFPRGVKGDADPSYAMFPRIDPPAG